MVALATAFVEARLDTSALGADVKKGMNSSSVTSAVDASGKTAGAKFKSAFGSALGKLTVPKPDIGKPVIPMPDLPNIRALAAPDIGQPEIPLPESVDIPTLDAPDIEQPEIPKPDDSAFSARMKVIGAAGGAALAGGLGVGLNEVLSTDALSDKLAAQLGIGAKESKRLGELAGRLYSNAYGDSLDGVNTAIRGVVQNISGMKNAATPRLEAITASVLDVAAAFDEDSDAITRAAGQLVRTGLAKNAREALDVITVGFQSGADKSDDLLDTLNEYGTQFRKLGLDGKTATGLLSQGLQAGARDADIVADVLKEFTLRTLQPLTETTKVTADGITTTILTLTPLGEAFQHAGVEVLNAKGKLSEFGTSLQDDIAGGGSKAKAGLDTLLDGMRDVKDPLTQSRDLVSLFGTQAEDMGAALLALDPSTAVDGLGKVGGAAEKMGKTLADNAQTNLTVFWRTLKTDAVEILGGVLLPALNKLGPIVGVALDVIKKLGPAFVAIAAGAAAYGTVLVGIAAVAKVQAAITFVQTAATYGLSYALKAGGTAAKLYAAALWLVNAAMRANPIGIVVTVLAALVAAFIIAYKKSETFRAIVNKTWDVIKSVTGATWDFIKGVFGKLKDTLGAVGDAWQKVRDVIKAVWDRIKDTVKNAVDAVKDALVKAWDAIRDKTRDIWDAIRDKIRDIWGGIKDLVKNAADAVRDFIVKVWDAIRDRTRDLWDGIKTTIGNAWDNIKNVVKNAADAVRTQINNAWDAVRTGTSNAWGKVKEVIGNAWDGIKKALGGVGEFLRNTVVDAFRTAVNAIEKVWDRLKGIAVAPVNFVIKWVYNQGIRDLVNTVSDALKLGIELPPVPLIKFAKGGVVPGRDTGKDYVPAMMRGGEGVLVPETVRKLGGAYGIERLNKWGTRISGGSDTGGSGAGPGKPSTAGVGIIGDWAGKLKAIVNKLGDIGGSPFADIVKGSAKAVLDGVGDWIKKKVADLVAVFVSKGGWTQPMKKGSYGLSQGYKSDHPGVDLDIPNGPPYENVYATHSGRVHFAGWGGADSYGNYVQLRHGLMGGGRGGHGSREMHTLYAHLHDIIARAGAEVKVGSVIGHAGTTGKSSGDHLHFETRWNGSYATQSPLTFMAAMGAPLFDGGGKWPPGLGLNLSGHTEAVLDPRASRAYERVGDFLAASGDVAPGRSAPFANYENVYVTDLDELMRKQRREAQRAAVMATT